jgi:glucose/arabinose dehydrogenase/plastocyanin
LNKRKRLVIPIASAAVVLLAFLMLSVYTYSSSTASGTGGAGSKLETRFYGCTSYDLTKSMHCDPLMNKLVSYIVPSNSSRIFTNAGVPMLISGRGQTGLQLDAKRMEAVELPVSFKPDQSNFSISIWVKQAKNPQQYGVVVSHANRKATAGWSLDAHESATNQSAVALSVYNDKGETFASPSAPISNHTFTQIVTTFDGSHIKIYQNGTMLGSTAFKGKYTLDKAVPLRIGSSAFCLTCDWWSGTVKDLRFYNRAMDATDIKKIFEHDLPTTVTNGLVGYWTFDGSLNDVSGNKNQGLVNSIIANMASAPDGRLFFDEKDSGRIMIMKDDKLLPRPFVVLSDYYVNWEQGLLGLTIDPKFEENHFVYLYYTAMDNKTGQPHVFNKLVRFTDNNNQGTNMVVLIDRIPASNGYHSGGALAFGPDDKLYVGVGDATQHEFAQDPGIVIGKVLRINRDGTIPQDNPFPNSPVYTIGHRNIFGLAFDKQDGDGIITEPGDYHYDKINLLQKGSNYGFPNLLPPNSPSPNSFNLNNSATKPLISYWQTITPTQAIYYTGDKIPQLKDKFLVGSYNGDIYALTFDTHNKQIVMQQHIALKHYPFEPVTFIAQSQSGDIYYGSYHIYKLTSVDVSSEKQDLFPIGIRSSSNVDIKGIQISNTQGRQVADIQIDNNNKFSSSPRFIQVSMPKAIIPDVSSVAGTSITKDEQPSIEAVDFAINSNSSSPTSAVNINLKPGIDYPQFSIKGAPEINATKAESKNTSTGRYLQNANVEGSAPENNTSNAVNINSTSRGPFVSIVKYASDSSTQEPYNPSTLSIAVHSSVNWMNNDAVPHTVTEGIPGSNPSSSVFNSGVLGPGQSFQHIFNQAGILKYYCTIHPWMSGEIIVK